MKAQSLFVKMNKTQKRQCGQVQSWVQSVMVSASGSGAYGHLSSKRSHHGSLLKGSLLLVVIVALASLVPEAAAVYRFPPSSSSSLSSADAVADANAQGPLVHFIAGSALGQNQAALFDKSKLQSAGQKEAEQPMNPNEVITDNVASLEPLEFEQDLTMDAEELDKRAKWNSLQGGWGKRAANNWNKLSAAWGKRRVSNGVNGWNNLSGMWGKKRAKWNELSGMWGKRAWNDMSGGWGKKKRSGSSPHWNKLRGMWGKRSAVAPLAPGTSAQ